MEKKMDLIYFFEGMKFEKVKETKECAFFLSEDDSTLIITNKSNEVIFQCFGRSSQTGGYISLTNE